MSFLRDFVADKFKNVTLSLADFHGYQHIARDFMAENPLSALFLDTGLGKTGALLYLISWLIADEQVERVLIIAPMRVANVTWPDEIGNWEFSAWLTHAHIREDLLAERINDAGQLARSNARLQGKNETQIALIVEDARLASAKIQVRAQYQLIKNKHIHLIHKEQVEFLVDAWGKDWPYDTVIIDESSGLKDHRTGRWKALWKVRKLIKRQHQLTATPASESYAHLFGQINLLDGGERFGRYFSHFTEKYFISSKYTRKLKLRPGAEGEIVNLISDICLVMKQEDYLELQQPQFVFHPVRLPDAAMDLYETMETDFIIQLPDGPEIEAETAAALSQKLLQMASGVVYETVIEPSDDQGNFRERRVVHKIHDEKIETLRQLQEDLNGENLLVAYYHQASLDRLLKAFPEAKVMDKEGKLIKEWNAGKIKILLLHPQSGAHGLNLQRGGRHVVWFDAIYSYENYYQFFRRLARQGQKDLVIVHHLVAKGTIDEPVFKCMAEKRDAQEMLFNMIKRRRSKLKSIRQIKLDADDVL